jgi:putative SOS response-associated peptidase YedK
MPVITAQNPKQAQLMQYGLITSWSKHPETASKLATLPITAVTEKPSFRRLLLTRRCLIPTTSYYGWQKTKKGKQPFSIGLTDQPLFAFAGLYDVWRDQDGRELRTFAIVTTRVVGRSEHTAVVLTEAGEAMWLNPEIQDVATLRILCIPYPESSVTVSSISSRSNDYRRTDQDLYPFPR